MSLINNLIITNLILNIPLITSNDQIPQNDKSNKQEPKTPFEILGEENIVEQHNFLKSFDKKKYLENGKTFEKKSKETLKLNITKTLPTNINDYDDDSLLIPLFELKTYTGKLISTNIIAISNCTNLSSENNKFFEKEIEIEDFINSSKVYFEGDNKNENEDPFNLEQNDFFSNVTIVTAGNYHEKKTMIYALVELKKSEKNKMKKLEDKEKKDNYPIFIMKNGKLQYLQDRSEKTDSSKLKTVNSIKINCDLQKLIEELNMKSGETVTETNLTKTEIENKKHMITLKTSHVSENYKFYANDFCIKENKEIKEKKKTKDTILELKPYLQLEIRPEGDNFKITKKYLFIKEDTKKINEYIEKQKNQKDKLLSIKSDIILYSEFPKENDLLSYILAMKKETENQTDIEIELVIEEGEGIKTDKPKDTSSDGVKTSSNPEKPLDSNNTEKEDNNNNNESKDGKSGGNKKKWIIGGIGVAGVLIIVIVTSIYFVNRNNNNDLTEKLDESQI